MRLGDIKNWVNQNITPFAWQRVLMRKLPELRDEGYFFHTLQDDTEMGSKTIGILNDAVVELYKMTLPDDFLSQKSQS